MFDSLLFAESFSGFLGGASHCTGRLCCRLFVSASRSRILVAKPAHLKDVPKRVVSLVPGATETFFALGAGDLIVGLTYHDTYPSEAATKTIVGGFFDPSPELIEKLKPDVILLSSLQAKIRERFADSEIPLIEVDALTMEDGFKMIELVGENRQQERRSGREDRSNTKAA